MAETSTTTPAEALARERDRLLATKLHVPRPRPGFLARPRLLERLTEGTAHELTLVCAPAGFGKTSLLGDWARRRRQPVAWLSLDAGDSDPARFWRYVAAALDELRPGVGQRVDALFQGGQPPLEAVLTVLVNQLVTKPEQVVLVLDDYQLVEAPPVHQSLELLLERLPSQLRLVLASRADPPLPLARLRAGGQLVELREATCASPPRKPPRCSGRRWRLSCPRRPWRRWRTAPKAGWPACSWRRCRCRVVATSPPSWRSSPAATGTCWTT